MRFSLGTTNHCSRSFASFAFHQRLDTRQSHLGFSLFRGLLTPGTTRRCDSNAGLLWLVVSDRPCTGGSRVPGGYKRMSAYKLTVLPPHFAKGRGRMHAYNWSGCKGVWGLPIYHFTSFYGSQRAGLGRRVTIECCRLGFPMQECKHTCTGTLAWFHHGPSIFLQGKGTKEIHKGDKGNS